MIELKWEVNSKYIRHQHLSLVNGEGGTMVLFEHILSSSDWQPKWYIMLNFSFKLNQTFK